MKTSKTIRIWSLALGITTALAIVLSQSFCFGYEASLKKAEVEHHESSESPEGEQFINQPSYSQPVSSSFVFNHDLSLILEIAFGDHEAEDAPVKLTHASGKLFKALFHFIISPNAP